MTKVLLSFVVVLACDLNKALGDEIFENRGVFTECTFKSIIVTLHPTGLFYEDLALRGWPMTRRIDGLPNVIGCTTFDIPAAGANIGNGQRQDIYDIRQTTQVVPRQSNNLLESDTGQVADLSVEAVFFDGNQYMLGNIFDALSTKVGYMQVLIPDLFADVNGDGVIGEGDTLYSLVDLNVFLSFNTGVFTWTNIRYCTWKSSGIAGYDV
jgi:hypothetical protein